MWEDSGVAGTRRFLDRAHRLVTGEAATVIDGEVDDADVERALHAAIKKVTEAAESLAFNTAISEMMIFVNEATRAERVSKSWLDAFVRILAPFAPHLAEELWQHLGHDESITWAQWPQVDEAKLAVDTITLAVQVNGKVRGQVDLPVDVDKDAALAAAKQVDNVARHLEGKTLRREIYVAGRLINLVVG
jgi:leucyl-tRNA synthetase